MHAIAIGILIVVCQLFWLTNGKRPSLEIIQQYTEQYCTSDTPDAVKGALMAVFPATSGTLKDEDCDLILQIVLDNMGNHPAAKPSE
ncbi:hypothetical protein BOTBODRAFT_528028 [Botryobasidium botryosum FD-172 SS1]|uniref:Uncharacterized protein n=1 Tax=Botryobasidium botryosum (strain FD-172 SS1) TaxID=930990 RepID=A0A067MBW2_BOTB1|nr:hypothetical protein BOTBODRAFT_528028 [Botryobasidium botryosum FD-172 SS1]